MSSSASYLAVSPDGFNCWLAPEGVYEILHIDRTGEFAPRPHALGANNTVTILGLAWTYAPWRSEDVCVVIGDDGSGGFAALFGIDNPFSPFPIVLERFAGSREDHEKLGHFRPVPGASRDCSVMGLRTGLDDIQYVDRLSFTATGGHLRSSAFVPPVDGNVIRCRVYKDALEWIFEDHIVQDVHLTVWWSTLEGKGWKRLGTVDSRARDIEWRPGRDGVSYLIDRSIYYQQLSDEPLASGADSGKRTLN